MLLSSEFIDKKTDEELVPLILKDQEYFLYLVRRYEEKLMQSGKADEAKTIFDQLEISRIFVVKPSIF